MKTQKYLKIFFMSVQNTLKNYPLLIGLSLFLMICLVIFANLWEVLANHTKFVSLSQEELLWYIAWNQIILVAIPRTERFIEKDFKSGRFAYLLPRPISYPLATFFDALGTYLVNLIFLGIVTVAFTYSQVGFAPMTLFSFISLSLLTLFAGIVAILFLMLIGFASFWLHEIESLRWIWEKLLFVFGGLMLPLVAYPNFLRYIAWGTPFPWILGGRSALVFDCTIPNLLISLGFLSLWAIAVIAAMYRLYFVGLKNLYLEDG